MTNVSKMRTGVGFQMPSAAAPAGGCSDWLRRRSLSHCSHGSSAGVTSTVAAGCSSIRCIIFVGAAASAASLSFKFGGLQVH